MTEPRFLGPVRETTVQSLDVGVDISLPFFNDGIRSAGYRSTVKGFNDDRTEMTVFIHKTGETVTVEVEPTDVFVLG